MSFTVIDKESNERYQVYDITYKDAAYPKFLIYKNNQWVYEYAFNFRPFSLDDVKDSIFNTKEFAPLNIFRGEM